MSQDIDKNLRILAAMAYGEASTINNKEEIYALASVLERQRIARGYKNMEDFIKKDKTFSFVVSDGNKRYEKLMKASKIDIINDVGMNYAINGALNAIRNGVDYSNGAFFWDGADIKTNYKNHFKVKNGIKFINSTHNIYNIKESTKVVILKKHTKKKVSNKIITETVEIGHYDHIYESTAAYGGTIFWKQSEEYLKLTKSKEYR